MHVSKRWTSYYICAFKQIQVFFFLSLGPDIAHLYAVDNFLFAVPSTQTPQFAIEVHGLLHLSKVSSTLIFRGIICFFFHGNGYFMVSSAVFLKNRLHYLNWLAVLAMNKTQSQQTIILNTIYNIWRLFLESFTSIPLCMTNYGPWQMKPGKHPGNCLTPKLN